MAIYSLPPLVNRITGSRKGITIQKAGTNFIMRKRAVIVQKRSTRQSRVKSLLASRSQVWRTLTAPQQASWVAQVGNYTRFDSLGVPYNILPNPLQILTNVNADIINQPPLLSGTNPVAYPVFTVEDVGFVEGIQLLEANIEDPLGPPFNLVPAGFSLKVYFSSPISDGAEAPSKAEYKLVSVKSAGFDTFGFNHYPEYLSAFPAISFSINIRIFCGMVLNALSNYVDDDLFLTGSGSIDP